MSKNVRMYLPVVGDADEDNRRVSVLKDSIALALRFYSGDKLTISGVEPSTSDPEAQHLVVQWGCREDVPSMKRQARFAGISGFIMGCFLGSGGDPGKVKRLLGKPVVEAAKETAEHLNGALDS